MSLSGTKHETKGETLLMGGALSGGLPRSALQWKHLPPLPPAEMNLPPVLVGADFPNGDNDLGELSTFAPSAPTKLCRYPEEVCIERAINFPICENLARLCMGVFGGGLWAVSCQLRPKPVADPLPLASAENSADLSIAPRSGHIPYLVPLRFERVPPGGSAYG